MDHKYVHHVAESRHQLSHNFLNNIWVQFPLLHFHELLKVITIAKLYEYVVPSISLNCLFHPDDGQAVHCVLVLDLRYNEAFLGLTKIFALHNFACI